MCGAPARDRRLAETDSGFMLLEFSLGVAVPLFVQEMLRPSLPGFFLRLGVCIAACVFVTNRRTDPSGWRTGATMDVQPVIWPIPFETLLKVGEYQRKTQSPVVWLNLRKSRFPKIVCRSVFLSLFPSIACKVPTWCARIPSRPQSTTLVHS